ncbi:MAG TPA: tripartite tricarboxylate transporter substrate binding protein [Burkholderiales bacterium]|nr:tripartite tricarboxylate transporter substrate binding protein [Burkholderiales bacterium]
MTTRLALLATALFAAPAFAQPAAPYPVKPIRAIVPFTAGGPTDLMARALGQKLTEAFGQQVIVDNRGGGSGIIAATLARDAPPDGYTIFFGTISTLATNPATIPKLPYDPLRDFAPITMTAHNPYFLVVHPSVPAANTREFIALARSKPGQLNYASSGTGGAAHLVIELFRSLAKLEMVHVPYKGAAPSMADLVAGQVHMTFAQPSASLGYIRAKRLRALGVTSLKPLASWPEAGPVAEAGLPGFESSSWQGVVAPARTPPAIIRRLYDEVVKALATPDLRAKLAAESSEAGGMPPAEFRSMIAAEIARWTRVVKDANIRIE